MAEWASLAERARMIIVTEGARETLKATLIASEADTDEGLRVLPSPDGRFVLALDTELSGDLVIEHEGYKILLIGLEYLRILDGKTIDCQDTRGGMVLFVR
jgi:hypothetical protein